MYVLKGKIFHLPDKIISVELIKIICINRQIISGKLLEGPVNSFNR